MRGQFHSANQHEYFYNNVTRGRIQSVARRLHDIHNIKENHLIP